MQVFCRGCGDPVLFIHGVPTNNQLWAGVIERLQHRHACVAVDLPGLGKTPAVPYGPSYLDSLTDRIEEIRESQGIKQWHVVGHDAGSAIAVHYAHRYPGSLRRLALLSPAIFPDLKPFYLLRVLRRPVMGEFVAPLVNFVFWKVAMRRAIDEAQSEPCKSIIGDFYAPFSGLLGAWHLMRISRWGNPCAVLGQLPSFLPELLAPTLIFQALGDTAVPPEFAARASKLIPNCELISVKSGHFLPLNSPELVAAQLLRFFQQPVADRLTNATCRLEALADVESGGTICM